MDMFWNSRKLGFCLHVYNLEKLEVWWSTLLDIVQLTTGLSNAKIFNLHFTLKISPMARKISLPKYVYGDIITDRNITLSSIAGRMRTALRKTHTFNRLNILRFASRSSARFASGSSPKLKWLLVVTDPTHPPSFVIICPQLFELSCYSGLQKYSLLPTRGHSKEMHTHAKEAEVSPGKVWWAGK